MKAARAIKLGIVCLTAENLDAPWILFEAGALSKTVDNDGRVAHFFRRVFSQDVKPPFSMFQATRAEKEDMRRMLHDLNTALGEPLKPTDLDGVFEAMWPQLDEAIRLEPETRPAPAKRSPGRTSHRDPGVGPGVELGRPEGPSLSAALSGWTPSESSISPETWKTLAEFYGGIAPVGTLPLNALLLRNLGVHAHQARIPRTDPAPEPPKEQA